MVSILRLRNIEWEIVEYGPNERNITGWGFWMSERSRKLVVEGGEKVVDFNIKAFKPAPAQGIDDAVEIMRDGMMFRYQPKTFEESHVSMFEKEFAEHLGSKHAVAVNSCGSAMFIAMNIAGVNPGDKVLSNAFTFTAVPSAIHHARAHPVFVESTDEWGLDVEDLERKVIESGAKVLLMSYMRGHVPDMDTVMEIVERHGLFFIEDCAHAYMTSWGGTPLGRFGQIACFSTQSSKGLSSGEGGILTTDVQEYAAKAILYAGSYEERWNRHHGMDAEMMGRLQNEIPGYSMRMTEVTGALLRPQIPRLHEIHEIHKSNYRHLEGILEGHPNILVPKPHSKAEYYCDTMQFHLQGLSREDSDHFIELMAMEGIGMQIFGVDRNARDFREWHYLGGDEVVDLPRTIQNIEFACDLSLQPHLDTSHMDIIASVMFDVLDYINNG